jgi:peptide/nickel transport system substrate-binding protein
MKLSAIAFAAAALVSLGASAQTLNLASADSISSLDPQLNQNAGDLSVNLHFWSLLVGSRDNKIEPALAASWKLLDPTTWEFKLRDDVKWQDGQPFTADDVIFSYERARHVPGSSNSYAGYLRTIASMSAKDAHTLIIKTTVPSPDLLLNLTWVYIVSKHVGENSASADYNSGRAMVGDGPFKFVSYAPGDRVTMERNDSYWGPKPVWEKVNYRYIADAASRTAALLAGDVDAIAKVSVSDVAKLKASPKVSVFEYPGWRVLLLEPSFRHGSSPYITDNEGKPLAENPLLDVRVRRALSLAIDRHALVDRVLQGGATVANQWMPAGTFGYNPEVKDIAYDAAQAKKLLADAGFPQGFHLTISVPGDRYPQASETAQAIAQFWTRVGVKTQVESLPYAVYLGRANNNEFAVSMLGWGNGTGEAAYAIVNVMATVDAKKGLGASNWSRYSNPTLDTQLDRATAEMDDAKRAAILRDAVQTVSDDVGILPLFHYKNIWAAKKGLTVRPLISDRTAAVMVTIDKDAPAAQK